MYAKNKKDFNVESILSASKKHNFYNIRDRSLFSVSGGGGGGAAKILIHYPNFGWPPS